MKAAHKKQIIVLNPTFKIANQGAMIYTNISMAIELFIAPLKVGGILLSKPMEERVSFPVPTGQYQKHMSLKERGLRPG